ncbi:putative protein cornichon -like protein 2 [Capsicum annuum]|nr:putative protein cornichon -like protein 2 [Capsicum annuum]
MFSARLTVKSSEVTGESKTNSTDSTELTARLTVKSSKVTGESKTNSPSSTELTTYFQLDSFVNFESSDGLNDVFLIALIDLEFDYINPYQTASRINRVVLPEFTTQGVLCFLYLITGHWVISLYCVPCLYYNVKLSQLPSPWLTCYSLACTSDAEEASIELRILGL